MINKFFSFYLSFVFVLLISSPALAQTDSLVLIEDDFESYTPGVQLACQDTIHIFQDTIHRFWDTWNSIPCDPVEDPYITNTEAHSGVNSVWIQQNNDLVSSIPDYTYGKYSISFYMYIPSGYTASWGQLAAFYSPDSTEWGFYIKFDPFGNGIIVAGGWGAAQFTFSYDTWMNNELIVDLNTDLAEYYFEGNLVHSWQWTLGSSGDTCSLQLSKTDILGSDWPNPDSSQWYMDDYKLERLDTTVGIKDFSVLTDFILDQNYPNPFNPATKIKYQIPELSFVTLKVFDVLGNEIAKLVNEEKPVGNYEIELNAAELPSGVYFYRLQAGSFVETKKMILMK
jgi:hypothetical protein